MTFREVLFIQKKIIAKKTNHKTSQNLYAFLAQPTATQLLHKYSSTVIPRGCATARYHAMKSVQRDAPVRRGKSSVPHQHPAPAPTTSAMPAIAPLDTAATAVVFHCLSLPHKTAPVLAPLWSQQCPLL